MLETILTIILAIVWLGIIPFLLGVPVTSKLNKKCIISTLIYGLILYFSIFQVLHVGFLLLYNDLTVLSWVFATIVIILSIINIIKYKSQIIEIINIKDSIKIHKNILWIVVIILIAYQVYMTAMYQFVDGDDSVYAVTAATSDYHDIAYGYESYTGNTTGKNIRHAFSGAPIFVAFLARVIMVHTATVHHIIFPCVIVMVMYMIYGVIAKLLMKSDSQNMAVFMIFINLLFIFGNTSIYSSPTFLLTRTAQGKSILANIVVPIVIMLIIMMVEDIKKDELNKINLILLGLAIMCAGFCSILGLVLVPMLVVVSAILLAAIYRKWKVLGGVCVSVLPAILLAGLYLIFYRDFWYM